MTRICTLSASMLAIAAGTATGQVDGVAMLAPEDRVAIDHVAERLIVRFEPGFEKDAVALTRATGQRMLRRLRSEDALALVEVQGDMAAAIRRLEAMPGIAFAEPDYIVRTTTSPNDSRYGDMWGLNNFGQTVFGSPGAVGGDINAEEAWEITTGDEDFVIAVIDGGTDPQHPDLAANIFVNQAELNGQPGVDDDQNGYVDDIRGWDFFDNDNNTAQDDFHGSHVSGTIASVGNNGFGTTGVMWQAKILPLRFIGPGGGATSDAVEALDYAVAMGVKLSNNSWGGGGFSSALSGALTRARDAGHVFVSSAGNNGDSNLNYPAGYGQDNIVSVANITNRDVISGGSSRGFPWVDIGAPGTDVLSINGNNGYSYATGTSMASPHVAGVIGLLWSHLPNLTSDEVIGRVYRRARSTASMSGYTTTGTVVDAGAALAPVWLTLDGDVPEASAAGEPVTLRFLVESDNGALIQGSPTLWFRDGDDGAFEPTPLAFAGSAPTGAFYEAVVTPSACGSSFDFYATAESGDPFPRIRSWPAGGEADAVSFDIEDRSTVLTDDFQTDLGWTVANALSDGGWTRGTPVAFGRGDPIRDFDGSGQCWLTDNVSGNSDVDSGTTTLTSPSIDVSGLNDAYVSYATWYNNADGSQPNTDTFDIDISNDDGATWTRLETIGPAGPQVNGGWFKKEFRIADVVAPTATVRVRFIASDDNPQSLVEAAVDAFAIYDVADCSVGDAPCNVADLSAPFGILDLDDVDVFIGAFTAGDSSADVAEPFGIIDLDDVDAFIGSFLSGCP